MDPSTEQVPVRGPEAVASAGDTPGASEGEGAAGHRHPHTAGYQRERMKAKRGKGKGMLLGGIALAAVGVVVLVVASLQELSPALGWTADIISFVLITGGVLLGVIGLARGG